MSQCTYRIKDGCEIGWLLCQREEGHPDDGPPDFGHQPHARAVGKPEHKFEGVWHRPEAAVDQQVLKEGNSISTQGATN